LYLIVQNRLVGRFSGCKDSGIFDKFQIFVRKFSKIGRISKKNVVSATFYSKKCVSLQR
jgi:hypothetical protein